MVSQYDNFAMVSQYDNFAVVSQYDKFAAETLQYNSFAVESQYDSYAVASQYNIFCHTSLWSEEIVQSRVVSSDKRSSFLIKSLVRYPMVSLPQSQTSDADKSVDGTLLKVL